MQLGWSNPMQHTCETASGVCVQYTKNNDKLEHIQWMAIKMVRGLGNMTYKDRPRELCLFSSEKRGNRNKLELVKFQLGVMKKAYHENEYVHVLPFDVQILISEKSLVRGTTLIRVSHIQKCRRITIIVKLHKAEVRWWKRKHANVNI
ncbi:hypothetical protein QYF61_014568 [Mycteria americana]|uniref:Uncharacterized protein n=1 Tax=Mycteria americana TaxID=33587 RepID=A0AAN7NSS1_MYCAM|nr:hypothetical protein QYF61_014568 [Mycteria americana]